MSKYKDFDSLSGEPLVFKIGGKDYEIPSDLSPEFVLSMMTDEDKPKNDTAIFFAIITETLGEEAHNEIKRNASWRAYEGLVKWVVSEVLNVDVDASGEKGEEGKGESETPSPSPSLESSSTGHSLKGITGGFGGLVPQTTEEAVG